MVIRELGLAGGRHAPRAADKDRRPLVSIKAAAQRLGVAPATLQRLERDGEVKGYGLRVYYTPGGQRRYCPEQIDRYFHTRGFAGKLGAGERPMVLVVDCINAITGAQSPLSFDCSRQIEHINRVLDAARAAGCPVIHSHSCFDEHDASLKLRSRKVRGIEVLDPASNAVALDSRLRVERADAHVYPRHLSVYFRTGLLDLLTRHGCDTLVLCGFSTSGAVRTAAAESLQYGIRPLVAAEAVGDRDEALHRNNLADIESKFADVLPVGEVVGYMDRRALAAA